MLDVARRFARTVWWQARTSLRPAATERKNTHSDEDGRVTPVLDTSLTPLLPGHQTLAHKVVNRVERHQYAADRPAAYAGLSTLRRVDGVLREVLVRPQITAVGAALANRDQVVAICTAAGVDYFLIPEPNARRARIGILADNWDRFVEAAATFAGEQPIYALIRSRDVTGRLSRSAELLVRPAAQAAARSQTQLSLFSFFAQRKTGPVRGASDGCLVERWTVNEGGALEAPAPNKRSAFVSGKFRTPLTLSQRSAHPGAAPVPIRSLQAFEHPDAFDITFPIDVVYTWVDGDDPVWQERKQQALAAQGIESHPGAAKNRFANNDELRYSMRSVEQFAPWVRHIFLVTDGQVPTWLDPQQTRVTLVDHRDIFPADALPTFNSHSIGARLHHIEGLSEHYLHLNDDVFLGRPVHPSTFFDANGVSKFFLSRTATLGFFGQGEALPHEQARRNVAELLFRDFGSRPHRVFWHTPIAQQRSIFFELEKRYPEEMARTWRSRFRDPQDFEPNSWFHHYYGYLQGYTRPGNIAYGYYEAGLTQDWALMQAIMKNRNFDTFCINDNRDDVTPEAYRRINRWMRKYFPRPSSFELFDR